MGVRGRFLAFTYDRFSKRSEEAGLAEMRRNLIAGASGEVLEIGAGTGANLGYYGAGVESLTLTEPEPPMLKRLQRTAQRAELAGDRSACSGRGSPVRGRELRHGRLDARPLRC